ncbi:hypothetical protein ACVIOG_007338 [Rhizobium leguminosarum]
MSAISGRASKTIASVVTILRNYRHVVFQAADRAAERGDIKSGLLYHKPRQRVLVPDPVLEGLDDPSGQLIKVAISCNMSRQPDVIIHPLAEGDFFVAHRRLYFCYLVSDHDGSHHPWNQDRAERRPFKRCRKASHEQVIHRFSAGHEIPANSRNAPHSGTRPRRYSAANSEDSGRAEEGRCNAAPGRSEMPRIHTDHWS